MGLEDLKRLAADAARVSGIVGMTRVPGVEVGGQIVAHSDERRAIVVTFNFPDYGFAARQCKTATMNIDAELGGHFHHYQELFLVEKGVAVFELEQVSAPGVRMVVVLTAGMTMRIPPEVAHQAWVLHGTKLVGFTESPYTTPAECDHRYSFE